jgi:hypothetical protein
MNGIQVVKVDSICMQHLLIEHVLLKFKFNEDRNRYRRRKRIQ